jgi:DNA-binding transcriptional LysR family regulator
MNLNHFSVFLAVAETRSFTGAAEKLRADKAHVSRVVSALERDLGVVLVSRTTRKVSLTPAGQDLAAKIASPLAALESAGQVLVDRPATPSGQVTLATTPDIGRALVAPLVAAFRARFPAVRVKLVLESTVVSFADEKVDLALRVGTAKASGLKVRKLGELEAGFFASPRYLVARGTPSVLRDLGLHDGLWPAESRRKSFATASAPPPPAVDCDDFGALLELARSGAGVAVLPLYLAAREVSSGTLVRVVPELALSGAPLFVVTRPERPLPPRIAALRDFLVSEVPPALAVRR